MNAHWRAILVCAAIFGGSSPVIADGCPVAGSYTVVGRIPGATASYHGEAVVSARGNGCHMKWYPPNDSEGTGDYTNGVLTINFTFANGGSGVVKYTRAPNGEMHGTWWMNASPDKQGTETLIPIWDDEE